MLLRSSNEATNASDTDQASTLRLSHGLPLQGAKTGHFGCTQKMYSDVLFSPMLQWYFSATLPGHFLMIWMPNPGSSTANRATCAWNTSCTRPHPNFKSFAASLSAVCGKPKNQYNQWTTRNSSKFTFSHLLNLKIWAWFCVWHW